MNYNGYVSRNSIIHRMNPSLKFLLTFVIIVMIFIPYGFLFQLILLVICLGLFFIAKLPFRKLFSIIKSILIMMLILLVINWVTYKTPGVIFDINSKINNIFTPSFLSDSHYVTWMSVGNEKLPFIQGDIYGGGYLNFASGTILEFDNKQFLIPVSSSNGFIDFGQLGTHPDGSWDTTKLFDGTSINNLLKAATESLKSSTGLTVKSSYGFVNGRLVGYFYYNEIYSISTYAIMYMLYVSLKIFLMILVVTILTSTTSSLELTSALEDILNPFRVFKLPVNEWSMVIALGLRFIPSLLDESGRILKAQSSRGLDFSNGSIKDRLVSITSLISPLFTIAFKKSGELSNAMEARGYNPRYLRTRYREYRIYVWDWLFFGFVCFLLGLLITFVSIGGKVTYISPLGVYEALTMFG